MLPEGVLVRITVRASVTVWPPQLPGEMPRRRLLERIEEVRSTVYENA